MIREDYMFDVWVSEGQLDVPPFHVTDWATESWNRQVIEGLSKKMV